MKIRTMVGALVLGAGMLLGGSTPSQAEGHWRGGYWGPRPVAVRRAFYRPFYRPFFARPYFVRPYFWAPAPRVVVRPYFRPHVFYFRGW
jgi:hypothetical protein